MVVAHIKNIKHSMLCVNGVYLRDVTGVISTILQLNASHLSICSCCFFQILFSHRVACVITENFPFICDSVKFVWPFVFSGQGYGCCLEICFNAF